MTSRSLPWVEITEAGEARVTLDLAIYSLEGIKRAAYWLTGRAYVYVEPADGQATVLVRLAPIDPSSDLAALAGEFVNRVLDEDLRRQVFEETRPIRELIVAQAFAEADLPEVSVPADPGGPVNTRD